jgi:hypothetical protein
MKNRATVVFVMLTLILTVCILPACASPLRPPSDADIIKAIDGSGIMNRPDGSFTVVPPAVVVEKGRRNKDGSWPVKVKFTLIYRMKDGQNSPPTETTTSFRIFQARAAMGKSVWKALSGS